ncbi:Hok/Gef family protein [Erwinia sp. Leaf53]|nr:Hok/Gef family protein [Erwinia sp. Leaf53]
MAKKLLALCIIVVCVTEVLLALVTRGSLCELRYKQGGIELQASLACHP